MFVELVEAVAVASEILDADSVAELERFGYVSSLWRRSQRQHETGLEGSPHQSVKSPQEA